MNVLTRFLIRALLIAAGLIFAVSLMVLTLVLLVLWCVRALWCKLTGQPVNPFSMRINPRTGFDQVFKRAERGTENLGKPKRSGMDDVTDVEPKR